MQVTRITTRLFLISAWDDEADARYKYAVRKKERQRSDRIYIRRDMGVVKGYHSQSGVEMECSFEP